MHAGRGYDLQAESIQLRSFGTAATPGAVRCCPWPGERRLCGRFSRLVDSRTAGTTESERWGSSTSLCSEVVRGSRAGGSVRSGGRAGPGVRRTRATTEIAPRAAYATIGGMTRAENAGYSSWLRMIEV